MRFVWNVFSTLHRTRGAGAVTPNPLSFMEIDAWSRLMQVTLAPWEVELVRALDDEYFASLNDEAQQVNGHG
jgi:hypothetical protein